METILTKTIYLISPKADISVDGITYVGTKLNLNTCVANISMKWKSDYSECLIKATVLDDKESAFRTQMSDSDLVEITEQEAIDYEKNI